MLQVGQTLPWPARGDFTILRFVLELGRDELEDRVGYERGRLDLGAIIAVMLPADLAGLTTTDFTLGASTRWSRSSAAAPWAPKFAVLRDGRMHPNAIESKLAIDGKDPQAIKAKVLRFFRTKYLHSPAKVFPAWRHENGMEYPDAIGAGVPQFRLHNDKRWVVERIVLGRSGAV